MNNSNGFVVTMENEMGSEYAEVTIGNQVIMRVTNHESGKVEYVERKKGTGNKWNPMTRSKLTKMGLIG